jgi:hypothetical protein
MSNLSAASEESIPKQTLADITPLHYAGKLSLPARKVFKCFGKEISTLEDGNRFAQKYLMPSGERWKNQTNPLNTVMETNRSKLLKHFAALGQVHSIYPEKKTYEWALILSDIRSNARKRFEHFQQLVDVGNTFQNIALLSGGQPLEPEEMDGLPSEATTQTDMMIFEFNRLPCAPKFTPLIIDSPMQTMPDGSIRRPNTDSTVKDFLATKPAIGACLALTNNPHIPRQTDVVRFYLDQEKYPTTGAGPAAESEEAIITHCGEFARGLYMALQLLKQAQHASKEQMQ